MHVQPQLTAGSPCDDGVSCTSGDECAHDGSCSGETDPHVCTSSGCATSTCDPSSPKADVSGCVTTIIEEVCECALLPHTCNCAS